MIDTVTVGIADMKISRAKGSLITYALGSCIGVCLYDNVSKIAGLLHIMLPMGSDGGANPYKYANTGLAETIRKLEVFGCVKRRMTAKIAGGAKMFEIPGQNDFGNIGQRNIEVIVDALRKENIPLVGQDVGRNYARTMLVDVATGSVTIRVFGKPELYL